MQSSVNNGRQQSHDCHAGEYEQDLQQRLPGKHGKKEIYGQFHNRGQFTTTKDRRIIAGLTAGPYMATKLACSFTRKGGRNPDCLRQQIP